MMKLRRPRSVSTRIRWLTVRLIAACLVSSSLITIIYGHFKDDAKLLKAAYTDPENVDVNITMDVNFDMNSNAYAKVNLLDSNTSGGIIKSSEDILEEAGSSYFPENHACSVFGVGQGTNKPTTIPSAITLWREHLTTIFEASKHKNDKNFDYHDFTALLLHYMTPERLQSSVKALPSQQWDRVGDILDIAFKRWIWLQHQKKPDRNATPDQNEEEPRKVKILLSGASLSMGVNCCTNPIKRNRNEKLCSWPARLEHFIGAILEPDLIQIDIYSEGGMTTFESLRVFESTRFSKDQEHPDIVIHAHSTNDQHFINLEQARKLNITLEENILLNNDRFVRHVLSMKYPSTNLDGQGKCVPKAPLLLYFDDTLGNEEKGIFRNLSFSRIISSLSSYYGFGVISYADAVRDLVYADSREKWFSAPGWPKRQVHPGMGMHISSTWTIAYNFLNLATTYCMLPLAQPMLVDEKETALLTNSDNPHGYKPIDGLPKLRGSGAVKDGPSPRPLGVLPALDDTLTLNNIGTKWNRAGNGNPTKLLPQCNYSESRLISDPCIFSWTTGKSLPNKLDETPLPEIMNATLTINQGWGALKMNHGKKGQKWGIWKQVDSNITTPTFVMEFSNLKKPVEMLEFLEFTSDQEASKVHVDISVIKFDAKTVTKSSQSADIIGSIKDYQWYARHRIRLDVIATYGDTMRIKFHQVGPSFTFAGMRFCDAY